MSSKSKVEKRVREIKRRPRRTYNTEEKIRIVLEGFRGRKEGINHLLPLEKRLHGSRSEKAEG